MRMIQMLGEWYVFNKKQYSLQSACQEAPSLKLPEGCELTMLAKKSLNPSKKRTALAAFVLAPLFTTGLFSVPGYASDEDRSVRVYYVNELSKEITYENSIGHPSLFVGNDSDRDGIGNGDASGYSVYVGVDTTPEFKVTKAITGASSDTLDVINNKVVVKNSIFLSTLQTSVVGGNAFGTNNSTDNLVEIYGSIINKDVIGGVSLDGLAKNNTVLVDNTKIESHVLGSKSERNSVSNSAVTIQNGSTVIGNIYGGQSLTKGFAKDNIVTVDGSTVNGKIVGGFAAEGNATGNIVIVDGSTVNGDIAGGFAAGGDATDNTVIIKNTSTVRGSIYGGYNSSTGDSSQSTGNTLQLHQKLSMGAGQKITGFNHYEFYLSNDLKNGDTFLTVGENNPVDVSNSTFSIESIAAGSTLGKGDSFDLISNSIGGEHLDGKEDEIEVEVGITQSDKLDITYSVSNKVSVNITDRINIGELDKAHAVTAGADAAFMGNMEATFFAATQGMNAFINQASLGEITPFIASGHRSTSYDENRQDLDIDGQNFMLGLGFSKEIGNGNLHLALFGETGQQDYDSFQNAVKSQGENDYSGGGIISRYSFENGLFVEGLVRMGEMDTSYQSDFGGTGAIDYDYSSDYLGAYIGAGKEFPVNRTLTATVKGRYIYSSIDGGETVLKGDETRFDDAEAHTVRIGGYLTHDMGNGFSPYGGLMLESTFNSDLNAVANGMELETIDPNGFTTTAQAGVQFQKPNSPWAFDANVSGYNGVRDGYSANVVVKLVF